MQNEPVAQPLAVLFVNCRKAVQQRLRTKLADYGFAPECRLANSRDELTAASLKTIDVIFAGLGEGSLDVQRMLQDFQQSNLDIPVILLGTPQDEEKAVTCLNLGATDALLGPSLLRLGFIVRKALDQEQNNHELSVLRAFRGKFFEAALQPALMINEHGMVLAGNRLASTLLGYSQNALSGQPLRSIFPSWSYPYHDIPADPGVPLQINWGSPEISLARKQDGKLIPVEWRILKAPGMKNRWILAFLDKSKEFEAVSERVVSEDRLQAVSRADPGCDLPARVWTRSGFYIHQPTDRAADRVQRGGVHGKTRRSG